MASPLWYRVIFALIIVNDYFTIMRFIKLSDYGVHLLYGGVFKNYSVINE